MLDPKLYIQKLLEHKGVAITARKQKLLDDFISSSAIHQAAVTILEQQTYIMKHWRIRDKIDDIMSARIVIPNATVGKPYSAVIDYDQYGLTDLVYDEWTGLEELGLQFDKETKTISGIPAVSGELKFSFHFKVAGESESDVPNIKTITLIVNPDPKSLWKNIPSDRDAIFWKPDDAMAAGALGDRHIVVASNRGRSHENNGSFRDDDFAFKYIENTGWSVVAVSDGAGSYSLSRRGSQLACSAVVEYFEHLIDLQALQDLESKIRQYESGKDDTLWKDIAVSAKQQLYKAVLHAHHTIKTEATQLHAAAPELFDNPRAKSLLDYFHATLIFTLLKKFDSGYIILTFGVGDCPIAIVNRNRTDTVLLNKLDVGEFGGGTRFVTQSDIYQPDASPLTMAERFNVYYTEDFSYLFLMTDGIYDAKFVVEANLEKHEQWEAFIADLEGDNDEHALVDLDPGNEQIAVELAAWMDFWSPGNHDDRTLAIIY